MRRAVVLATLIQLSLVSPAPDLESRDEETSTKADLRGADWWDGAGR